MLCVILNSFQDLKSESLYSSITNIVCPAVVARQSSGDLNPLLLLTNGYLVRSFDLHPNRRHSGLDPESPLCFLMLQLKLRSKAPRQLRCHPSDNLRRWNKSSCTCYLTRGILTFNIWKCSPVMLIILTQIK